MEQHEAITQLSPLIGEWSMEAAFPASGPSGVRGRALFEWLPGGGFLVQRWEVPHPDAPDGIAIVGAAGGDGYLQHYFDSRGVARLYEMSFGDGLWTLSRTAADFSPLSFSQRFTARFSDDGDTIAGRWEMSHDGSSWELDFELTYTRSAPGN